MDFRVVVPPCGRPNVCVPIEEIGWRHVSRKVGSCPIVAVNFHLGDFAKFAASDELISRFEKMRRASPLEAHLDRAIIFPRGSHHGLPLDYVVTNWLLDVNVGATFARFDHRQAVPMIGRCNQHDFRALGRKQFAKVSIGCGPLGGALPLCNEVSRLATMRLSTSHNPTTSTGATCIKCKRSVFPYQPQPMSPTRMDSSLTAANAPVWRTAIDAALPIPDFKNSRRCIIVLPLYPSRDGKTHRARLPQRFSIALFAEYAR